MVAGRRETDGTKYQQRANSGCLDAASTERIRTIALIAELLENTNARKLHERRQALVLQGVTSAMWASFGLLRNNNITSLDVAKNDTSLTRPATEVDDRGGIVAYGSTSHAQERWR